MARIYRYDHIDDHLRPPLVIHADASLLDTHVGTVHVEAGTLFIRGTLQGTLDVQARASAVVNGTQQGTVVMESDSSVYVNGMLEGTVTIADNAVLIVETEGKFGGTLVNDGLVVVRGLFAGARSGNGELRLEQDGRIQQHTLQHGAYTYEWIRAVDVRCDPA